MDNEKLAESELKQKLVVNELADVSMDAVLDSANKPIDITGYSTDGADGANSAGSSTRSSADIRGDEVQNSDKPSGKREPALIPVKPKPRGEQKLAVPAAVRKTRNRYIAIALITTFVGIFIVPIAWATWTVLSNAFPQSKGVEFFMQPKDRSQEKADQWREKMRSMLSQISKMQKPGLTKPATGYGDPRVGQKVLLMLNDKKFDQLNKTFEDATKNRVEHRTGSELLDDLYKALSDPGDIQGPYWEERLGLLKEWSEFKPDSATPHIVLADFYINYAWNARGSGWANQVKDWQWKLFRDRLYLSAEQLEKALAFGTPSPEWFEVAQINTLGAGTRNDRQIYDAVTKLGSSFYPNYVPIYLNKVYYLQPRWYGTGTEWVDYVELQSNKAGDAEGDKLYARMVNKVAHLYNNVYKEVPNLNKARVDRGNALLDKQFGGGK